MKTILPKLLLLFMTCLSAAVLAQTGIIQGTVSTVDGLPAEWVNVGLTGTQKTTVTTKDGKYKLEKIEPGTYTLEVRLVGLESQRQQIVVKAGDKHTVDFLLHESSQHLSEAVILCDKSNNERPAAIGKVAINPMDLPQSISIINKEVLDQQQVLRVSDVLKHVNGVYQMGNSGGGQEEIAGRGFAFNSTNTFKNGVRFNNTAMPEMSGVEQVEFLKGSTAILFGNVAAGGIMNLITKKPLFEQGGEMSLRMGSNDFYKPSLDIYGPFGNSKIAAYRLNTTYEKAHSFRDKVNAERFYINPSFLVKAGERTDILIEGDFLRDNRTSDFGIGAINYTLIDIPRSRFIGAAWSYYNTEQQGITFTLNHRLNHTWEIRNVSAYQDFSSELFGTARPNASGQFIQPDGKWIRGIQRSKVREKYFITQVDLTGRFITGAIQHTLLIGADADHYMTKNTAYNPIARYDSVNIYDMDKYRQRNDIPELKINTDTKTPVNRSGLYVQDLVSIGQKVKLLAGIRFSYLESVSRVYAYNTDVTSTTRKFDHALTPRLGIVYQPAKYISFFSSYANSFVPNTGVDIDGKALQPSYINQYEAGVKNDLFKRNLSANLTVYKIVNSNLAQVSLENGNSNSNVKELAGEVTSRGIELDVISKRWKGFSVIGGYSFNETRYTKSNTYIVGSKLRYNPNHTANASVQYACSGNNRFNGLMAGIGCMFMGERAAGRSTRVNVPNDPYKLIPLPAFTLLDASAGYDKNRISLRLKVTNILNALNYHVHDDNSVNPIAPRQLNGILAFKF